MDKDTKKKFMIDNTDLNHLIFIVGNGMLKYEKVIDN